MKQNLNTCQSLIAMGVLAMANDGRLNELNKDQTDAMYSITAEFNPDEVDLDGDARILAITESQFALMNADDVETASGEEDAPKDGAFGLLITAPGAPGQPLTMEELVYKDGIWIDPDLEE